MSDNLQGLGGIALWNLSENWKSNPRSGFEVSRSLVGFGESKIDMTSLSDDKPENWDISVPIFSKQEEYDFLAKFIEVKGRYKKFWFPNLQNRFTLKNDIASSSTTVVIEKNEFEFRGYERLFIKLLNGDRLSFEIASVAINSNDITITLATQTDRQVLKTNVEKLTLLHLCRLDTDEAELSHLNAQASEVNLRVIELVKEYP